MNEMFWKRRPPVSTVDLFEVIGDGASFSWNDGESRAFALAMFVELARRLEGESAIRRLRLSGLDGPAIDVSELEMFVRRAPELVNQQYQAYEFVFRLNGGGRAYHVRHLDQGSDGISFQTPVGGDAFWPVLREVLVESAKIQTRVRVSLGPWFRGNDISGAR